MDTQKQQFLKRVAYELLTDYHKLLPNSLILVPNKRARIFLFEYMREIIDTPLVAPMCFSSEEYAVYLAGMEKEEHIPLLFQLYESYQDIHHRKQKSLVSFEDFYFLGNTLLSDFDEIDRHLIHITDIYKHLSHLKSYEEGAKTIATSFSSLWDSLEDIYLHFTKTCKKNKKAYMGLIYRMAVESPHEEHFHTILEKSHIFWVGFYALSPAEEKLFAATQKTNTVYLDMDSYFTENESQEAGLFYRKFWKKQSENYRWIDSLLEKKDKNISILATPNETTMIKLLGEELVKRKTEILRPDEVAIILPKEELLFSVLNVLPEHLPSVNVTMGFPLRTTQIATWFESLFQLRESIRIDNETNDPLEMVSLSGQLLINVLDHQYTRLLTADDLFLNNTISLIREKNLTRVSKKNHSDIFANGNLSETLEKWFWTTNLSGDHTISLLFELTKNLLNAYHQKKLSFDAEFIYTSLQKINEVRCLMQEKHFILSFQAIVRVMRDIIQQSVIAFSGEPLEGWQIMGILEAQILDFETIYILSMNEGIIPPITQKNSFIPSEIRKKYHLSLPEEIEAIHAYHFYRLLKRSQEVFLFYTRESGESGEQEKSRYIEQILLEYLPQDNPLPREKSYTYPFIMKKLSPIYFPKTETIKQKLSTLSYSPSAFITYFQCSLRFYYEYLLGVKKTGSLEEDPDAAIKGMIIHKVMEILFAKGKFFHKEDELLALLDEKLLHKTIAYAIQREFSSQKIQGRLALLQLLIKEQLKNIIQAHKKHLPFTVLETETTFSTKLVATSRNLSLTGRIDRIDRQQNFLAIIDYKTGTTQTLSLSSDLTKTDEILHLYHTKNREHLFQLFFYAYLVKKSSPSPISPILLHICSIKQGKFLQATV